MRFTRLAGWAAVVFAAIVVVINIALSAARWPLDAGTTPSEVAKYFADHSTLLGLDVSLALINVVLMAVFGAGAFAVIWPRERDSGEAWSVVGVVGVAVMTGLFTAVVATRAALKAGHDTTGGLFDLHNALFGTVGIGLATILVGFSVGGLRTATIRRWHATLGVVSGALLTVSAALTPVTVDGGPAGLAAVGLVGFVGWLIWLPTFGVVLVRAKPIVE
jgi:hypothetical protein